MTAKTIDARLRKVEQRVGNTALAHLSDEALDEMMREDMLILSEPHGGDVNATVEALAASPDSLSQQLVKDIRWLLAERPGFFRRAA